MEVLSFTIRKYLSRESRERKVNICCCSFCNRSTACVQRTCQLRDQRKGRGLRVKKDLPAKTRAPRNPYMIDSPRTLVTTRLC